MILENYHLVTKWPCVISFSIGQCVQSIPFLIARMQFGLYKSLIYYVVFVCVSSKGRRECSCNYDG